MPRWPSAKACRCPCRSRCWPGDSTLWCSTTPSPSADIDITPLVEEDLLLVQRRPPGLAEDPAPGPITLRELAQLPLVIPTRPNAIRMQVETELANVGCRLNIGAGN